MADSDGSAPDAPVSALRRRRAKARAERAARLAASLRANIGRRKQQARDRTQQDTGSEGPDDPEEPEEPEEPDEPEEPEDDPVA